MLHAIDAIIAGTGSYVPEGIISNDDLEKMVDTNDEWITTRTGIKTRRKAADDETTLDLAYNAAVKALDDAGLKADDLDAIILPTLTPNHIFPATACLLQDKLGARKNIMAVDIEAACSGFLYGMNMGSSLIGSGVCENVLVVGADCLSKITDYTDRTSCILFGDGSGAAVFQRAPQGSDRGVLYVEMGADGSGGWTMQVPAGGSALPASAETVADRKHYMRIEGREVFKFAVSKMIELTSRALESTGHSYEDVKVVVPHQVNMRIIEAANRKLNIPMEKVVINIDRLGNTGGCSVGLALDEANRDGRIEPGDIVVFVAFGAGLTWGVVVMKW